MNILSYQVINHHYVVMRGLFLFGTDDDNSSSSDKKTWSSLIFRLVWLPWHLQVCIRFFFHQTSSSSSSLENWPNKYSISNDFCCCLWNFSFVFSFCFIIEPKRSSSSASLMIYPCVHNIIVCVCVSLETDRKKQKNLFHNHCWNRRCSQKKHRIENKNSIRFI